MLVICNVFPVSHTRKINFASGSKMFSAGLKKHFLASDMQNSAENLRPKKCYCNAKMGNFCFRTAVSACQRDVLAVCTQ